MKLASIVDNYPTNNNVDGEIEIDSLVFDSRKATENSLYICLDGENVDGHDFVNEAVSNGASAIVTSKKLDISCPQIIVDDTRRAFSYFTSAFYNHPQNNLKIIGVVGTNGKTSTCHIIKSILEKAHKKTAVIGTLGVEFEKEHIDLTLTTPDPTTLFSEFDRLYKLGAEYVVMEVSAHAIWLKKVFPIYFEALIFTNCTHDHLDYFKSFEVYRETKKSILNHGNCKYLIVNSDDELGRELLSSNSEGIVSYGLDNPSDVFAVSVEEKIDGLSYVINLFDVLYEFSSPLMGLFNVYNTLAAATICSVLGIKANVIADALKNVNSVKGRMEKVASHNGGNIFVDYAHTPDGLEKSLLFLRKVTKNYIILLFGCGGNRDAKKRKIMGGIAGDLADFVIITSDNPRFEEPENIIKQIEEGVKETSLDYTSIVSRKEAIKFAVKRLEEGDCLLVAGKGAEEYQEIEGEKLKFSDTEEILRCIREK